MSDTPGTPFGFGDLDPESLGDAPLFRELQRVMSGSVGPVNWELARQVAVATAVESGDDSAPDERAVTTWEEAVRVAELQVARRTGLPTPADVAPVRLVRRAEWVAAMISTLRHVLEPAAVRMSQALERAMREQLPLDAAGTSALIAQLGPLLQGTQVGQVFGGLARHATGRFDIAVPTRGPGDLLVVEANVARFEHDWSLDPTELRAYLALHEVAHRFAFARPWVAGRFAELVNDYLAGYTIDVEQRLKLARVQAFVAAAEGHADHVARAVAADLLADHERILEAVRRRGEERAADPVFERLLGVEVPGDLWGRGGAFCREVVEATDETTLASMWDSAEALPSLPEIDEPRLWLARTV